MREEQSIMTIGERIKELRSDENQASFGDRFGKNRDTIRRYELDSNPPDATFIAALCREYRVSPTWLLLGDGPKELRPSQVDAAVDMVKTTLGNDPEAAKRQAQRSKDAGVFIRQSRQEAEELASTIIADLGLDESKADYLRHTLQAPLFERLAAEKQLDQAYSAKQVQPRSAAQGRDITDAVNVQELLNMTAEVLVSDTVYRPALAANIKAFHRSIALEHDNQEFRVRIENMEARQEMEKISFEQRMTAMEKKLAEATAAPPKKAANG